MRKLIAIVNVVAWAGFWAFGYLALMGADGVSQGQIVIAMQLAFAGLATGIWAYLRLIRHSEETGYAKPAGRLDPADLSRAQQNWEGS